MIVLAEKSEGKHLLSSSALTAVVPELCQTTLGNTRVEREPMKNVYILSEKWKSESLKYLYDSLIAIERLSVSCVGVKRRLIRPFSTPLLSPRLEVAR